MNLIRFAIENPVKAAVGVILLILFGAISIFRIPIQLTPNVDEPRITVTTVWPGASAREVEREIVKRQEEKLKGVSNLTKMTSTSAENRAEVVLEFIVGMDKDNALRDVSDALRQVSGYPIEVEEPVVQAADAAIAAPIAWMIFRGAEGVDASTLRDFVNDNVKPLLERVEGLASVDIYGGREREVQIQVDAAKLAARGITFRDLERALRGENTSVSAGTVEQGKREYTYRTVGQYEEISQVENTVIAHQPGGPVYIRDVAAVVKTFEKQTSFVRSEGDYVLALPARRETGANVIKVMDGLKAQIEMVNKDILHPRGMGLELTQVYDETVYIHSAIDLVLQNLYLGGALAVIVLLVFLRNASATLIVAVSIPISVVGTFLVMALLGRNLNVVMLAGMAFAVGMVVDSAIVVVENIFRHYQMGKSRFDAALHGTVEVWGAVLASTLTTMAVFIPVVFVKEEAGQLFTDIALALSSAVGLSLVVAVLVIPAMANKILRGKAHLPASGETSGRIANGIARLVHWINGSLFARLGVSVGLTALSIWGSILLMPPTDYLPNGNRNLVFGFLLTPPGYALEEFRRMGSVIEEGKPEAPFGIRQFWEAKPGSPEAERLPPVTMRRGDGEMVEVTPPPIENFFYVSFNGRCFMGCSSAEEGNVRPLLKVLERAGGLIAGVYPIFFQTSLFSGISGGNTVELEIRGTDIGEVNRAAEMLFGVCMQKFGFPQPEPVNFNLWRDEIQVHPDRVRAAEVGLSVADVAFATESFIDGAYVGSFRDHGDEVDLTVIVNRDPTATKEQIAHLPLYTPSGRIVTLSSVADLVKTTSPEEIRHIEEMPAVMLTIRPPEGEPLEKVMTEIDAGIIAPMRASGALPDTIITSLAGNADKLSKTFNDVKWNLLLALLITYLLMAALFESFTYPFVIMLSVPPAAVGGFALLRVVHYISAKNPLAPVQQLDVLTMLGFIILIGIVVNNAILVVHQSLNNIKYGMTPRDAITDSVRTRVRPIFMTAMTTIFGLVPLVVLSGAGSELYRGLGAVLLGGLLVATVFTLFLVPAVFSLFVGVQTVFERGARIILDRQREGQPAS